MSKGVVIIDYGHGGSDSGAVVGKHIEKIYNYDTGKACKEELEKYGVTVYETRKGDEYLSISQRCAIAKKYKNVDYMVSIHHNAGGADRGECIHSIFGTKGKELAEVISKELKVIGQTTVKVYDREYNGNDYYGIIRGTTIPTVITEVAFLDNAKDVTICDTLEERQRNGKVIAHGILKKLGISIKTEASSNNSTSKETTYYRVVTNSYLDRKYAEKEVSELKKLGINAFLDAFKKDNKTYLRVIAGSYTDRKNADDQLAKLKKKGYDPFIAIYKK